MNNRTTGALAAGSMVLAVAGIVGWWVLTAFGAAGLLAAFVLWEAPHTGLTRRQRLIKRTLIAVAATPILAFGLLVLFVLLR